MLSKWRDDWPTPDAGTAAPPPEEHHSCRRYVVASLLLPSVWSSRQQGSGKRETMSLAGKNYHCARLGFLLAVLALTASTTLAADKSKEAPAVQNEISSSALFWSDPSDMTARDLFYGQGGKAHEPRGPFEFEKDAAIPAARGVGSCSVDNFFEFRHNRRLSTPFRKYRSLTVASLYAARSEPRPSGSGCGRVRWRAYEMDYLASRFSWRFRFAWQHRQSLELTRPFHPPGDLRVGFTSSEPRGILRHR